MPCCCGVVSYLECDSCGCRVVLWRRVEGGVLLVVLLGLVVVESGYFGCVCFGYFLVLML